MEVALPSVKGKECCQVHINGNSVLYCTEKVNLCN